jgi:16S rRNA processing protein RimM
MDDKALLVIGNITRPHSLHGEVRVRFFSDTPQRWAAQERFFMMRDGRPVVLETETVREHQGCFLFRFKGVSNRDSAEGLRNTDLYVERGMLAAPAADEYYYSDLEGLRVFVAESGEEYGTVVAVFDTGANTVLTVRGTAGQVNIPFIGDAVTEVGITEGKILVKEMFLQP